MMRNAPRRGTHRSLAATAMVALAAVALVATPASATAPAAQEQRVDQRTFSVRAGDSVDIENLVGAVTVQGISGGDVEIVATINAESGSRADAQSLLSSIMLDFDEDGDGVNLDVIYPTDRYDTYRYPQSGRGTYNTRTEYRDRRVRVSSRDDGDAVTLWVDIEVRVPAGVEIDIENAVGDVFATGVRADFSADTGSGDVTSRDGEGEVNVDTGSGDVLVESHRGDVMADTGSGNVDVRDTVGDVVADTGSGEVTLSGVEANRVEADTGSGDIELADVSGSISADTGSGDIVGTNLRGARVISADTGSGEVRLSGDMAQIESIEIDTSSGDVELTMGSIPGMRITVETGNGSINVDLPGLSTISSRRSYFRGEVGDGAARVMVDTASGDVRIRSR